jgi:hypothetical protein
VAPCNLFPSDVPDWASRAGMGTHAEVACVEGNAVDRQ